MSRYYDKDALKNSLEPEQIFDLLEDWGGQPIWGEKSIISSTICHNKPDVGSHKLYYYFGTHLFVCYTGCIGDSTFDIFDLCIKVIKNQKGQNWELYDAMNYIANFFGLEGVSQKQKKEELIDWQIFKRHEPQNFQISQLPVLKEYNPIILTRFTYLNIKSWEKEGISSEVCRKNFISYYPGGEQIVIPHWDINNRLIGIRGRSLSEEAADRFGKYRPLKVNKQLYSHPLSMNLYHIEKTKDNIRKYKTAIVLEGEKSCLQYQAMYDEENDISVACCGQNLSTYQVNILKSLGVREIILALDRQFQAIGDDEFKKLKAKLLYLYKKYKNSLKVSIIFDKNMITPYKASPTDCGKQIFEQLLKERIML